MSEISIKNVNGHYELSIDGKFIGSHDTATEAAKEAEEETKNAENNI